MVCNIVAVGAEKHLKHLKPAIEAVKGVKLLASSRSIEAVQHCHELGRVDLAFVEHGWTSGREEFSDGLRKVFRDKFNNTPIVCFGNPKSGGKQGQDYHYTMEDVDPAQVADYIKRAIAGQLSVNGKPAPRKSVDEAPARKSIDAGEANLSRTKSITRAPSMTRAASIRQKNSAPDDEEWEQQPVPGWGNRASMRRGGPAMEEEDYHAMNGMPNMMMGRAPSMRRQSMEQHDAYSAMPGVPPLLNSAPSMRRQSMERGMADGMGGMSPMGMNGMGVNPMMMHATSMRRQSFEDMGMGGMAIQPPQPSPLMVASNALMAAHALAAVAPAPALAPAPAAGALTPEAKVGGDLVKMLTEEVVRLRKAVDEKRRASLEQPAAPISLVPQMEGLAV